MGNQSILKQWLCDSVVAFLLILAGIVVSRHLAHRFQADGSVSHLCCLLIAEIPFVCFLGMRRGFFRWWEYAGFFVCVVSMSLARDVLVQPGANGTLAASIAMGVIFGCFISLHQAVQSHFTVHATSGGAGDKSPRS